MTVLDRFLKYVAINTKSDEESGVHPSYAGEFDLAKVLKEELLEMGLSAKLDDKCYLMAAVPATKGCEDRPAIGFIAHMDTSPAYSGKGVKPIIHENYDGSDITYPCGKVMKVSEHPFLSDMKGETLITSDGTTLLGADDKAGVAQIMTAISLLVSKDQKHGKICIAFTPDEEIGEGADSFDVKKFGADYAYTVDGGDVDQIEYENFNAADAVIDIRGFSVHPGSAKGVMINASNVAHELHGMLPAGERPETTQGYEGFYHLTSVSGNCDSAKLHYIIRDHDAKRFEDRKEYLRSCVERINEKYKDDTAVLTLTDSYCNMLEKIRPHMHLIETAKHAIQSVGLTPKEVPIRGGTDGARLSYMGLPCPNLGTGGFNFHGPFECITKERMEKAVLIILDIIRRYAEDV